MANRRKAFNFRSGLQVDNDNFVINEYGLVGIGTSAPSIYKLNIYGNTRNTGLVTTSELYAGVGTISNFEATNANITGVLTATQLDLGGTLVGSNLVGYAYTAWITSPGDVGLHTLSSVGVGTTAKSQYILDALGNVNITGDLTATNLSGTLAATNISGTLTNNQLPSNITATFTGDLTGTATTASSLSGTSNISASNIDASGIITANQIYSSNIDASGIITANQIYSSNTLHGVDLSLSGADSSIEVNGSNSASISIGNTEVGIGNSYASFSYSNNSLNISNFDIGDINSYLQVGTTGLTTGRFNWYDGDTNILLMTLTHQGRLGIGRTDPVETFEVVGTSTVTTDSYVGNNLYVGNDLNVTGSISGNFTLPDPITSNVNTTSGISTFGEIHVFGGVTSKIGIGTDSPDVGLDARDYTAKFNTVAINTTSTNYDLNVGGSGNFLLNVRSEGGFYSSGSEPVEIYVDGSNLIFNVVGIGSTSLTLS